MPSIFGERSQRDRRGNLQVPHNGLKAMLLRGTQQEQVFCRAESVLLWASSPVLSLFVVGIVQSYGRVLQKLADFEMPHFFSCSSSSFLGQLGWRKFRARANSGLALPERTAARLGNPRDKVAIRGAEGMVSKQAKRNVSPSHLLSWDAVLWLFSLQFPWHICQPSHVECIPRLLTPAFANAFWQNPSRERLVFSHLREFP